MLWVCNKTQKVGVKYGLCDAEQQQHDWYNSDNPKRFPQGHRFSNELFGSSTFRLERLTCPHFSVFISCCWGWDCIRAMVFCLFSCQDDIQKTGLESPRGWSLKALQLDGHLKEAVLQNESQQMQNRICAHFILNYWIIFLLHTSMCACVYIQYIHNCVNTF